MSFYRYNKQDVARLYVKIRMTVERTPIRRVKLRIQAMIVRNFRKKAKYSYYLFLHK